jgi:hypothetical protein
MDAELHSCIIWIILGLHDKNVNSKRIYSQVAHFEEYHQSVNFKEKSSKFNVTRVSIKVDRFHT